MRLSRLHLYVVSGLLCLLAAAPASGATVTIAWDRSPDPSVTNYNVFVSTQYGVYGAGTAAGNRTTWTFTGLANNVQYYFAVQAQNSSGLSQLSQIGYVTPIPAPPGSDRSRYYSAGFLPGPVDPTWRIASIRDFDGNGSPDIWWRNQNTGDMLVWFFNGTICIGAAVPTPSRIPDLNWKLKGTADFTGDGRADALWQHEPSGELRVWQLGGPKGIAAAVAYNLTPATVAAGWRAVALGDANLDGFPDIFWQNLTNGGLVVWLMKGLNQVGGSYLSIPTVDPTWRIAGPK